MTGLFDVHCYYQRDINFNAMIPEIIGGWHKVTDGRSRYSKLVSGKLYRPEDLINRSKEAGKLNGGYHYCQLGDPIYQANLLCDVIEILDVRDLNPAMDLEAPFTPGTEAKDFGQRFCNRVRERGYTPTAYMNDSMGGIIRPDTWDSQPVLWIARYGAKPIHVRYDVHQYTSTASLLGVTYDLSNPYNDKFLRVGTNMSLDQNDLDKIWYGKILTPDPKDNPSYQLSAAQVLDTLLTVPELISNVNAGVIDYDRLSDMVAAKISPVIADAMLDQMSKRLES